MMVPLLLGCAVALVTLAIQVWAVVLMLRQLFRIIKTKADTRKTLAFDFRILVIALAVLFVGHIFQVAVWALVFTLLGEFEEYAVAFYHSMVNFASLGYGDIVMSESWRLLGAIEASVGVLMFGLTAGIMIALMQGLFTEHRHYISGKSSD